MIFAIVPAAGLSTRMGRPKLSLPFGDRSVLENVVAALRDGGVDCVLVVVAPHVRDLGSLAKTAGAEVSELPEATPDMRATVEHGLDWLQERFRPLLDDRWLLAPADHPTLNANIVRQLLATSRTSSSILVPIAAGKRGHPTVFTWRHVRDLQAFSSGEGINAYLRHPSCDVLEVPIVSDEVNSDLDTPEDYARLLAANEHEPRSP
jgi:molybdenum cofactor cytidylyltransferase